MRKQKIRILLSISIAITLFLSSVVYGQPLKVCAASTSVPVFVEGDETVTYESVQGDSIFYMGAYYTVIPMVYADGTYNTIVLVSQDKKIWKVLSPLLERSATLPLPKTIRVLNNHFIVSLKDQPGQITYVSKDGVNWEITDLKYEDVTYYGDEYWGINSKGAIYYSKDLISWEKFTQLEIGNTVDVKVLDLCVSKDVIVVSHYNPKWGSNNYKKGLATYDRTLGIWKETSGYDGHIGATKDIIWSKDQFILTYQNDYEWNAPVLFYGSPDGFTWTLQTNRTALVRSLLGNGNQDTDYAITIQLLRNQIEAHALNGELTSVQVTLNGEIIQFDQGAVIKDGRTLVPVRKLFEVLGGTITWDAAAGLVTAQVGNNTILITIGSKTATVNGKAVTLDVPAQIIGGRTLVPVRFVADSLGKEVEWDKEQYVVKISTLQ